MTRKCLQAQCFDLLVRDCVDCELLSTHEPDPGKLGGELGQPSGVQGLGTWG